MLSGKTQFKGRNGKITLSLQILTDQHTDRQKYVVTSLVTIKIFLGCNSLYKEDH